ncbi:hypothetical protein [Caulobacter sp. DWR3-1-2]|uniref:hypothetical protein n=1 Tax=Caulobacter sp. DWR3-1-2 TaxID=2804647 RepID=UPI003CF75E2A
MGGELACCHLAIGGSQPNHELDGIVDSWTDVHSRLDTDFETQLLIPRSLVNMVSKGYHFAGKGEHVSTRNGGHPAANIADRAGGRP